MLLAVDSERAQPHRAAAAKATGAPRRGLTRSLLKSTLQEERVAPLLGWPTVPTERAAKQLSTVVVEQKNKERELTYVREPAS